MNTVYNMKVNFFANVTVFSSSHLEAVFGLCLVFTTVSLSVKCTSCGLCEKSLLYLEHLLKHHERHQV